MEGVLLPLPATHVYWRSFRCTDSLPPQETLENARYLIATSSGDSALVDTCLVTIDTRTTPLLWCFSLSIASDTNRMPPLENMTINGLVAVSTGSYALSDVYPCSEACSTMPEPCSNCPFAWNSRSRTGASILRPRLSLRMPHTRLLVCLREWMAHKVCTSPFAPPNYGTCQGSRGLIQTSHSAREQWTRGWDTNADSRRLIGGQITIQLVSAGLLVQCTPRISPYTILDPAAPSGTPIVLLPQETPAYFVGEFDGSISSVQRAFQRTMVGRGITDSALSNFVVCWIPSSSDEANRGVVTLWPRSLCLACPDRPGLSKIPDVEGVAVSRTANSITPEGTEERASPSITAPTSCTDTLETAEHANAFVSAVVRSREQQLKGLSPEQSPTAPVAPSAASSPATPRPNLFQRPPPLLERAAFLDSIYPSPPDFTSHLSNTPNIAAISTLFASHHDLVLPQHPSSPHAPNTRTPEATSPPFNHVPVYIDVDPDAPMLETSPINSMLTPAPDPVMLYVSAESLAQTSPVQMDLYPPSSPIPQSPYTPHHYADTPSFIHPHHSLIDDIDSSPIRFPHYGRNAAKYIHGKFLPSDDSTSSHVQSFRDEYRVLSDPRFTILKRLRAIKERRQRLQLNIPPSPSIGNAMQLDVDEDESETSRESSPGIIENDSLTYSPEHSSILSSTFDLLRAGFTISAIRQLASELTMREVHDSNSVGSNATPARPSSTEPLVSIATPMSPAHAANPRHLEGAARVLVKEAVENSLWRDAFDVRHRQSSPGAPLGSYGASPARTSTTFLALFEEGLGGQYVDLMESSALPAFTIPKDTRPKYRQGPSVEPLMPPMVSVAQGSNIISLLPSAAQFWDKLGLAPVSGPKDVFAYALFEPGEVLTDSIVRKWLERMSEVYTTQHFGQHTPCPVEGGGLIPLRWNACSQTLGQLLQTAPSASHILLYAIIPSSFLSLSFAPFRHFSAALTGSHIDPRFRLVFVPESLVLDRELRTSSLRTFALSVYNRLGRSVQRAIPRQEFPHVEPTVTTIVAPALTISRPGPLTLQLVLERAEASDPMSPTDRFTIIHVAYRLSASREWLFAACIDQRGEAHDVQTWMLSGEGAESDEITRRVLQFALSFAKRALIEWRIVISCLGPMWFDQVCVWEKCLKTFLDPKDEDAYTPHHVVILSVGLDLSITSIPKVPSPIHFDSTPTNLFADASVVSYAVYPNSRVLSAPPLWSSEPALDDDDDVLPVSTAFLINHSMSTTFGDNLDAGICALKIDAMLIWSSPHSNLSLGPWTSQRDWVSSMNDLAVLSRLRLNPSSRYATLPFHLAAVEIMAETMDAQDL